MPTRSARPLLIPEQTAPATPPAGWVYVYAKADGRAYLKDDVGAEVPLGGAVVDTDDIEFMAWWGAF